MVDLDFDNRYYKDNHRGELYRKIYGTNPGEDSNRNANNSDHEPDYVSGTNRKGHFVKQKRKPGKKGVKGYANNNNSEDDNRNNSKKEGNPEGRPRRSSTGSSTDSDQETEPTIQRVVLVQRHKPGNKIQPLHGPSKCGRYNCDICMESQMMEEGTHERATARSTRALQALDLSSL